MLDYLLKPLLLHNFSINYELLQASSELHWHIVQNVKTTVHLAVLYK